MKLIRKNASILENSSIILSIALLACLLPFLFGFYPLVRLAAAIIAACWTYKFYKSHKTEKAVIAGVIFILYQPIFKIALDRSTWHVVDIIVAVLIILMLRRKK